MIKWQAFCMFSFAWMFYFLWKLGGVQSAPKIKSLLPAFQYTPLVEENIELQLTKEFRITLNIPLRMTTSWNIIKFGFWAENYLRSTGLADFLLSLPVFLLSKSLIATCSSNISEEVRFLACAWARIRWSRAALLLEE